MRKRHRPSLWLTLLWLWLVVFPAAASPEGPAPRVVVISIDGLRADFYLSAEWNAPNLKRIRAQGAWAQAMLSVFPSVTYVNHTSLVTGAYPEAHGLVANLDFDWEKGPLPGWNWEASRIQVPALWDRTRAAAMTSAAFSWPVSVGAPVDALVPEIFHVDGANQDSTEALIRRHSTPGLVEAIMADRHLERFPQTFAEWDAWLPEAVAYVEQTYQPRLTLIHMLNMDWTQHREGPDSPASHQALKELDRQLGRLLEIYDPARDTVLIVGDHGFQAYQAFISPNRLLVDRGWVRVGPSGREVESWTVLAHTNGGSAMIFCKDPALEGEVLREVRARAEGHYEVLDRAELDRRHTLPLALCALTARPGYAMRSDLDKPLIEATEKLLGQHGHLPELVPTGLLAWGRGVEPGRDLGRISVLDVAPTVAFLLGLPREGMGGRVLDLGATGVPGSRCGRCPYRPRRASTL